MGFDYESQTEISEKVGKKETRNEKRESPTDSDKVEVMLQTKERFVADVTNLQRLLAISFGLGFVLGVLITILLSGAI